MKDHTIILLHGVFLLLVLLIPLAVAGGISMYLGYDTFVGMSVLVLSTLVVLGVYFVGTLIEIEING